MNTPVCTEKSLTLPLKDMDATLNLGARLGELLPGHGVCALLLFGRLGCGKTTLVRGLVSNLPGGHRAEVSSPSFTLCNMYPTIPPVVHCDLYRSDEAAILPEEAQTMLDEQTVPDLPHEQTILSGLVLIEWAERLSARERPPSRLDIRLIPCQEGRLATLCPHGKAARGLLAALAADFPA